MKKHGEIPGSSITNKGAEMEKNEAAAVKQWEAELDALGASADRVDYLLHLASYPKTAPKSETFHYLHGYLDGCHGEMTVALLRSLQINRRDGYQAGYLSGLDEVAMKFDDIIIRAKAMNLPAEMIMKAKAEIQRFRRAIVRS